LVIGRRPAAAGLSEPPVLPKPIFKNYCSKRNQSNESPVSRSVLQLFVVQPIQALFSLYGSATPPECIS
jgi:hypothetical protein